MGKEENAKNNISLLTSLLSKGSVHGVQDLLNKCQSIERPEGLSEEIITLTPEESFAKEVMLTNLFRNKKNG